MTPVEKDPTAGMNAAVAAVLRGERAASGLTIEQLADKAGMSSVTVQRLLQAKRHIDVAVLEALAQALGVSSRTIVSSAESRLARDARYAIQDQAARDED